MKRVLAASTICGAWFAAMAGATPAQAQHYNPTWANNLPAAIEAARAGNAEARDTIGLVMGFEGTGRLDAFLADQASALAIASAFNFQSSPRQGTPLAVPQGPVDFLKLGGSYKVIAGDQTSITIQLTDTLTMRLIGQDGAGLIGQDGAGLVGTTVKLIGQDGAGFTFGGSNGAVLKLIGQDGAGIVSAGAGNVLGNNASALRPLQYAPTDYYGLAANDQPPFPSAAREAAASAAGWTVWTRSYADYVRDSRNSSQVALIALLGGSNTSSITQLVGVDRSFRNVLTGGDALILSAFTGYLETTTRFNDSGNSARSSGATIGASASYVRGGFFLGLAFQTNLVTMKYFNGGLAGIPSATQASSMTFSVAAKTGYRFFLTPAFYLEPTAGLNLTRVNFGADSSGLGLTGITTTNGNVGLRAGLRYNLDNRAFVEPNIGVSYSRTLGVSSAAPPLGLPDNRRTNYGEVSAGVDVTAPNGTRSFARIHARFGDISGYGGSAGVSMPIREGMFADMFAPRQASPLLWTGSYIGLNLGGMFGSSSGIAATPGFAAIAPLVPAVNFIAENQVSAALAGGAPATRQSGPLGGFQTGFNLQYNRAVFGAEMDFQLFGGARKATNVLSAPVPPFPETIFSVNNNIKAVSWLSTLRGRLGVLAKPDLLVYGTGGLAYGEVRLPSVSQIDVLTVPICPFVGSWCNPYGGGSTEKRFGFVLGAGGEWMFAPNWSVKAEYMYYNLGHAHAVPLAPTFLTADGAAGPVGTPVWVTMARATGAIDGHILRVGVNYHFNWASAQPVTAKF